MSLSSPDPSKTPFGRAVDAAGGLSALATALGVRPSRCGNWYQRGVPEQFCPPIEAATGVLCEDLRPDVIWTRDDDGRITGYFTLLAANDDLPLPPGAPTAPAHHAPNGAN